jgi:hypothetical protein
MKWIPSQTTTDSKQEIEVKETRIIADLDSSKTGHKNENEKACPDGMTFVPGLGKCKDNDDVDPEDDNNYLPDGGVDFDGDGKADNPCTNCDEPLPDSDPEETEEDIVVQQGERHWTPSDGEIRPNENESENEGEEPEQEKEAEAD